MKIRVKKATGFKEKTLGLIDKNNHPPLLFKTSFGIHTFFLTYSIDVIVLDTKFIIRKLKQNLKPFSFYFYNPLYVYVLELENGFIAKNKLKEGDKIELVNDNSNR